MAKGVESQPGNENIVERGIGVLRNIHIGIGAAALGAEVVTGAVVFEAVAVYEGLNALAHEGLKRFIKNRRTHKARRT